MVHTNLLWISQIKEVQVALVSHLLVCGEHDDVAAEIKATRSDSRVGVEQGQLFTCTAQRHKVCDRHFGILQLCIEKACFYLPVSQSHSRQLLSADPVSTLLVSPERGYAKETSEHWVSHEYNICQHIYLVARQHEHVYFW